MMQQLSIDSIITKIEAEELFHAVSSDYSITDNNENLILEANSEKQPIGCAIMFRMQHLLSINLYDEKFLYAEEEALRKEFLKKYKITRLPVSLYRYRQHETNRSKNFKLVKPSILSGLSIYHPHS